MPRAKRQEEEQKANPNGTSCCGVDAAFAPVFVVAKNGTEREIGKVRYCPRESWGHGKKDTCFKFLHLTSKRFQWPSEILPEHFKKICDRKPPGYWLSWGYHIAFKSGYWMSLRELDYLPPYTSEDQLIPKAKAILAFRRQHSIEAGGAVEPAGIRELDALAKEKERAGSTEEFERRRRAVGGKGQGELRYEPGCEG